MGAVLNGLTLLAPDTAGRLAFYLFCLPRRKKTKPAEEHFLGKAELRYEQIDNERIAVYRWGNRGPVVLLAHGWESHAGRWRKIAPPLVEAGYQVVAVDAPAHGRSTGNQFTMVRYAKVLHAIVQQSGPLDAIIGHSVGAAASIWTMGTLPPELRPKRAVILASFGSLRYIMDQAQRRVGASDTLMTVLDELIDRKTGAPIEHYSLTRVAGELGSVETLLIHDHNDRVTAFRESELLHAAWPGAQFMPTRGFGHGLTAPEVIHAVVDFVRQEVKC